MTTIMANNWGRVTRDGDRVAITIDIPETIYQAIPAKYRPAARTGLDATVEGSVIRLAHNFGLDSAKPGREDLAALRTAYIAAAETARSERVARIAALFPGLDEIRAARRGEQEAYYRSRAAIERGDGRMPAGYAGPSSRDLCRQYPASAAYLRAQAYKDSSHYAKSGAGRRAVKRLESGEDYQVVLADMEREWSEAARRCVENA